MKHYLFFILLFFLLDIHSYCQENLILNPSFEDTNIVHSFLQSPASLDYSVKDWFTPERMGVKLNNCVNCGFSYYFNNSNLDQSSPNFNHVPNNFYGTIYPKSGNAYVGMNFLAKDILNIGYQASIETRIKKSLIKDHVYKFGLNYGIADIRTKPIGLSVYDLGILFTDSLVVREEDINNFVWVRHFIFQATPQLSVDIKEPFLLHNWTRFEGTFIAKGGEQFLTIGCFDSLSSYPESIFIYLDDLTLVDITPVTDLFIPNVFTPNGDGVNDFFEIGNTDDWQVQLQIFNRWGLLVFEGENNQNWDGTYQGQRVSEGVYFYVIHANSRRSPVYRDYKGSVTVMYD